MRFAAKKFSIESVSEFVKTVKKGPWAFFYDLKSAFHFVCLSIKTFQNHFNLIHFT